VLGNGYEHDEKHNKCTIKLRKTNINKMYRNTMYP